MMHKKIAMMLGAFAAVAALAAWMVMNWENEGGVYSAGRNASGDIAVIAPGHELYTQNEEVPLSVSGIDECPKDHGLAAKLFGQSLAGRKDCIVLAPDLTAVTVIIKDRGSEAREMWNVRWQGAEAKMFRPNGELVRLVSTN